MKIRLLLVGRLQCYIIRKEKLVGSVKHRGNEHSVMFKIHLICVVNLSDVTS